MLAEAGPVAVHTKWADVKASRWESYYDDVPSGGKFDELSAFMSFFLLKVTDFDRYNFLVN